MSRRERLRRLCRADNLCRTGITALVVGSLLALINQGSALLGPWDATLTARVGLTYLVPFVVANLGAYWAQDART